MKKPLTDTILISFLPLAAVSAGLILLRNLFWIFFLYHAVVCLGVPLVYFITRREKPRVFSARTGITGGNAAQSLIAGLIAGAVFFTAIVFVFTRFRDSLIDAALIRNLLSSWKYGGGHAVLFILYFVFFNSVVEEIFWRGFLCGEYEWLGKNRASLIVSFFFIQYHFLTIALLFSVQAAFALAPLLFIASVFWCLTRYWYGNIYAAVASHLAADLALMAVYIKYIPV